MQAPMGAGPKPSHNSYAIVSQRSVASAPSLERQGVVEHARLQVQHKELARERHRLIEENEDQEERMKRHATDIDSATRKRDYLEQVHKRLHLRFSRAEQTLDAALRDGTDSERVSEEIRGEVRRFGGRLAELKSRLNAALTAAEPLAGERFALERRAGDANGELRGVRAQLDAAVSRLDAVEDDRQSSVAALDQSLAAARRRVHAASEAASVAAAEARHLGAEHVAARAEHTAVGQHIENSRSIARSHHSAAIGRVDELSSKIQRFTQKIGHDEVEARGSSGARAALQRTHEQLAMCASELADCSHAEAALEELGRRESETQHHEARVATHVALELSGVEEQRLVDVSDHSRFHDCMESEAAAACEALRQEITHAAAAVQTATQSLEAVHKQLLDFQESAARMEMEHQTHEGALSEIERELSHRDASLADSHHQHEAVRADILVGRQRISSETAALAAQSENASRERRNLELEVRNLRQEHGRQAEIAAEEEDHRTATERRLRSDLSKAEDEWESARDALEARNALLAQQVLRLEGECLEAEEGLSESQTSLAALVQGHQAAAQVRSRNLLMAKARANEAEEEPHVAVLELQAHADALRAEVGSLEQGAARVEALNEGLRAQILVLQKAFGSASGASFVANGTVGVSITSTRR